MRESEGETGGTQPWDRQPGESMRWFVRFESFRLAGPRRALLPVVNTERSAARKGALRSVPPSWRGAVARWNWRARAEAWDAQQIAEARVADAEERQRAREEHLTLLRAYRAKVARGILRIDPEADKLWWRSATEALAMLGREFRALYDEEPVRRAELTGPDGAPLIPLAALAALAEATRTSEPEQDGPEDWS